MGKSNLAVDESPMKTDCSDSTSKFVVPLVQIDSISIDISCPMEEIELPPREHFSIRGFVAGTRRKNSKMLILSSEGDSDGLLNNQPPLSVPKFRFWQCSHCIPEIATEKNGLEIVPENRNDIAGTSSYEIVVAEKSRLSLPNKKTTGSKGKGVVRKDPYGNITEPIRIRKREIENPSVRGDGSSESSGEFIPLPNRRKQKLRSLADIILEEKNSMTGSASSNGITSMTTDTDAKLDIPKEDRIRVKNRHMKKKTIMEEKQEKTEMNYPIRAAKRSKRHALEDEKAFKRVENFDSEAETVASGRLDLHVKHKKNNILHNGRKQRRIDNAERPVETENASEINALASNYSFGCTAPDSSTLNGEAAVLSNGNFDLSNTKLSSTSSYNISWKGTNIQENVTLDLFNEKTFMELRGIPDLNESIIEKTPTIHESHLLDVFQKRSLSHDKILDNSTIGNEANAVECERRENCVELGGTSDDIPIEIVELLAKNRRERAIENSMQHFTLAGSPSTTNTGFVQGNLNFPQGKYFEPEICNPGAGQFKLFSSVMPIQQCNAGYFGSNSAIPGLRTTDLMWHPRRMNLPYNMIVGQNQLVPSNGFSLHSFSDQCYKGKNICSNGKPDSHDPSTGLFDASYSNVDIPAMQLLSLTNQRNVSESPFSGSFCDKPFSRFQHPNLNKDHLISSPFFSVSKVTNDTSFISHLQAQMPPQQGVSRDVHLVERLHSKNVLSPDDPRVCVLNKNPADFTILDANNEYTISAKDLKFTKRHASKQAPKRKWVRRNTNTNTTQDQAAVTHGDSQLKIKNARKNLQKKSSRQKIYNED